MPEFIAENGATFFWLFVAVSAAVIEAQTCGLVSVWFVPGALAAMLLSFFTDAFWVQMLVFIVISCGLLLLTKTILKKYMPKSKIPALNADGIIGTFGIVQEPIDNLHETGSVKVKSLIWTARSTDDAVGIPAGTVVVIRQINGVKLICEPKDKTEAG